MVYFDKRRGVHLAEDPRKRHVDFPRAMLDEVKRIAAARGRSVSWVVRQCVKVALPRIRMEGC